jgi:hypothetical protein
MGVLRRVQGRHAEAVSWFGRALAIASEHEMPVATQIMEVLAGLAKDLGEEEFTAAWRQAFDGQEPPMEALRAVEATLERTASADAPEQPR